MKRVATAFGRGSRPKHGAPRTRGWLPALLGLALLLVAQPSKAWLLHEHARITRTAVGQLSTAEQQALLRLWQAGQQRLGKQACAEPSVGLALPPIAAGQICVDFPLLPALAADHSCSTDDLTRTIDSEWIAPVLFEGARTEVAITIANAEQDHGHVIDTWRAQHIGLRMVDREYLSRARVNSAHFQAPRKVGEGLNDYLPRIARQPSAISLYSYFHVAALDAAHAAAACRGGCRARNAAAAIKLEGFALHFLEDAFSAGHIVASTGGDAERAGTHDYYCEHGMNVITWGGEDYIAHGDAFMRDVDLKRAAGAVQSSLQQLLAAFTAKPPHPRREQRLPSVDVCRATSLSSRFKPEYADFEPVLRQVPRPTTPGETSGHPHFRKEIGPFYTWGADVRASYGPREGLATVAMSPDRLAGVLGLGVTLDGITQAATDGILSVALTASAVRRPGDPSADSERVGQWRVGLGASWHLPYALVPFDTLLLSPFVGLVDAITGGDALMKMWLTASDGGLLGLQRRHRMPLTGHVQFVLGRQGSFTLYGNAKTRVGDASLKGSPNFWQLSLPVFAWTTVHLSDPRVAMDGRFSLGYLLTRLVKETEFEAGDSEFFHGIFISYGFESRRYF